MAYLTEILAAITVLVIFALLFRLLSRRSGAKDYLDQETMARENEARIEKLRETSDEIRRESEALKQESEAYVEDLSRQTREDAEKERDAMLEKARTESEARRKEAMEHIEQEKEEMLQRFRQEILENAKRLSEKMKEQRGNGDSNGHGSEPPEPGATPPEDPDRRD